MAKPTFEDLPTELLILILFQIPDLASLKSIVLSSPNFHQTYLTVRQEVLCRILKKQYGVLLGEAIAAIRSRGLYFESHKEGAIALLDTWRRSKEISDLASPSSRIDEPGNLEEILNLFYFDKELHFFLEDYATKAPRPAWIEHNQWENSMLPIELSHTEKFRFLRALCRLQTHANIFARPEEAHKNDSPGPRYYNDWGHKETPVPYVSTKEEAYRVFFGTMPPWEYEEMGCVWAYLKTKYDPIYKEISKGLHDLVKKHGCGDYRYHGHFAYLPQDVRPPLRNIESIRGLEDLPDCTSSLVAIGPEFLYRLLHATPLLRRDMVLSNADFMVETFIGNRSRMFVGEDEMLPLIYPADRHAVRDFEQFWSTLPSIEQPNLGWKRCT